MLWGNFRDDTLRDLLPPRGLRWEQGKTITSWWSIRDEQGKVQAIIVVYVDDFMLCGPMHLVTELGKAIQEVWETSELSFLGPDNSYSFSGDGASARFGGCRGHSVISTRIYLGTAEVSWGGQNAVGQGAYYEGVEHHS